jgi:hypothetical protein
LRDPQIEGEVMERKLIFGAIGVPVHKDEADNVWVLIKKRIDPGPKGIDHGKWEAVAKTFNPEIDEHLLDTVRRGCREELALPDLYVNIPGNISGAVHYGIFGITTKPYLMLHDNVGDVSFHSGAFVCLLGEKVVPRDNDESTGFLWCLRGDLQKMMLKNGEFSFTYAALWEICKGIELGRIGL